jgi:phosphate transport system substrate-binding protein
VDLCKQNAIEYIELPVAYDGLAVVIHPQNTWAKSITVSELKKLWSPEAQGKIMKWNDIRPDWPNEEIHLFGAGVDSGTYDYFTAAIVGKEHSSRGDFTSSEDDNVLVQGIATDKHALGFFGLAYYEENQDKLALLPIDDENDSNGKGPVAPSLQTVTDGTYQPLSRPIFIYVSTKAIERPEVSDFIRYYLANASKLTSEVGYIPLSNEAYQLAQTRVDQRITGSIFGGKGSQIGVSIEELLKKTGQ